jgi:hypothetical protein
MRQQKPAWWFDAVAQLLLHFERQPDLVHLEGVVDIGNLVTREFHVDDGADALNDGSLIHGFLGNPYFKPTSIRITRPPPRLEDLVS